MLSCKSEEFLAEDARLLLDAYQEAYDEVTQELRKPNVLIVGVTGAGKSSFINALFHKNVAPTGSGTPVTQHFDRYSPEDYPIVLYDSKGLEHGRSEEFIRSTRAFFQDHLGKEIKDAVHIVWYIVNSAMARFQDFEKHICKSLFNQVPIIFVLNKADLSTQEERKALRETILSMDLENCFGVFDTISTFKHTPLYDFEACPQCGSDDIEIRKKDRMMTCASCGLKKSIVRPTGLAAVVKASLSVLPIVARDSFVSSQKVSFHVKESHAKDILLHFERELSHGLTKSQLLSTTAKMLTRISMIWQFKEHGSIYGADVATHMGKSLKFRDRILLFLHQGRSSRWHALALGVLWNHCIRNLSLQLFKDTLVTLDEGEEIEEHEKMKEQWSEIIHSAFRDLCTAKLKQYAGLIKQKGLAEFLELEMPEVEESPDALHEWEGEREISLRDSWESPASSASESLSLSESSSSSSREEESSSEDEAFSRKSKERRRVKSKRSGSKDEESLRKVLPKVVSRIRSEDSLDRRKKEARKEEKERGKSEDFTKSSMRRCRKKSGSKLTTALPLFNASRRKSKAKILEITKKLQSTLP